MAGEKRSVVEVGDVRGKPRSYQMTLPKWWCRKHSFPEHVYVEEMEDGALRVEAG